MRSRILSAVGVSAVLVAATAFAGQASAHTVGIAMIHHGQAAAHATAPAKGACYSQTGADSGTGVLSTLTSDPAGYSSTGAVDFSVAQRCVIKTVNATGVYAGGSGPADSFTVTFYKAKAGLPGKVIGSPQTITGSFPTGVLSLPISKVTLKAGSYFVSVVGNMDYTAVGGWYWELTASTLGNIDVWENNGGGFGVCPTFAPVTTCVGVGNDFIMSLSNK